MSRRESSFKGDSEKGSQDPLEPPLRLAEVLDLTPDDVNSISWDRLQKPMRELDSNEIPLLIEHLEGHRRARSLERRAAS